VTGSGDIFDLVGRAPVIFKFLHAFKYIFD